jgi:hypothetical protein
MTFSLDMTLKYDPTDARATRKGFQKWWAMALAPKGLHDYYAHWLMKTHGVKLTLPLWGVHLTVIRGELPRHLRNWRKYDGQTFRVYYDGSDLQYSDKYAWLPAHSPDLEAVRRELGLRSQPKVAFHVTLGNRKNLELPKKRVFNPVVFPWEKHNFESYEYREFSPAK